MTLFNEHPRKQLQQLMVEIGNSICDAPERCEAVLHELCPEYGLEVNLLIAALKEKIHQDLLVEPPANMTLEAALKNLSQQLQHNLDMDGQAADWAVESWAIALRTIQSPINFSSASTSQSTSLLTEQLPVEIEMVTIKGGLFLMGSPETEPERSDDEKQHEVMVNDFEIGKYLVTQAQWRAVMGINPSYFKDDNLPVETVSWYDVMEFIEKLNEKTAKTYRLPTEAEWEYACRAGTISLFYSGNKMTPDNGNYNDRENTGTYIGKTTLVGSYPPNPWGLYDMVGNVWEWTGSDYMENYDGRESKHSTSSADTPRVIRGGSWFYYPWGLRSADRGWIVPKFRDDFVGFRLARG